MTTPPIIKMWPQLTGCTEGIYHPDKTFVQQAVMVLTTCQAHHGCHNFAVTDAGHSIIFSMAARHCLIDAGLLP